MAKTYSRMSHAERIARSTELTPDVPKFSDVYYEQVDNSILKDGVLTVVSEQRKCKLADRDKGFKWYDFSIDSLAASGMLSQASFMQLEQGSLAAADALDNIVITDSND